MRICKIKRLLSAAMVCVILLSCIPVTTWAVDSTTDIMAVAKPTGISIVEDYDDYVGENWLNELGLPTEVTVTLADGSTAQAAVTWDTTGLDPRSTGYYFLPGTVTLPDGATNGQDLEVSITVQVREKSNMIANGYMDSNTNGWGGSWTNTRVEYPAGAGEYVMHKGSNTVNYGTQIMYQTPAEQTAAATRLAEMGAGQYLLSMDVMAAPQGINAAREDLKIILDQRYWTAASTSSSSAGLVTSGYLSTTEWTTLSKIINVAEDWTKIRTDIKSNVSVTGKPGAYYIDNVELIPLKVALKVEPANIADIKTQIQARYVAVNYDKYMGEDWKESLGLPETVEVITDKGTTGSVAVTWDYSALDITKCGAYVLTGTLDTDGFPNPKGLTVVQKIFVRNADNLIANGYMNDGTTGWGGSWSMDRVEYPVGSGNYVLHKGNDKAISGTQFLYQIPTEQTAVANRLMETGPGQYLVSVDVMAAPRGDNAAREDLKVTLDQRYWTAESTSSMSAGSVTSAFLSTTEWTNLSKVLDVTAEWTKIRTDVMSSVGTTGQPAAYYIDNVELIALNVLIPLGEEPAEIVQIVDEIPVRAVIQNYDEYLGANWKEALGLPATVEVTTAKGNVQSVGAIWDYAPLNLDRVGKYTLVGTLDNSMYPNPNNLYVTQTIYVTEYKNLLTNGSFESGASGWGWGANYKENLSPAYDAKVSIGVKSSKNAYANYHLFYSAAPEDLAQKAAEVGAGQYYISGQLRDYTEEEEASHADPLKMYLTVSAKTAASSASCVMTTTNIVTLNTEYQQVSSVFTLNGDETWLRFSAYLISASAFADQWIMADKMELVPLTYVVEQYEGEMQEVQSIIPARNIIQNYPDYIDGYSTADLLFPETVEILSTRGETVRVGVRWDYSKLDLTQKGTYILTGTLEDMKLPNNAGLTVTQVVNVVDYQNLLTDGGFEDGSNAWGHSSNLSSMSVAKPKREGDYALEVTMGRMENYATDNSKENWLQAFYSKDMQEVGRTVTQTGAGRYFFGVWIRGSSSSTDVAFHTRLLYKHVANGDTSVTTSTAQIELSVAEFRQASGIVTMPGDVTWTRLDIWYNGSVDELRLSTLWMDDAELVPLNVEVPDMNDIIYTEQPADVYVYEGTSVSGLNLPEKLEILLKNTQRFDLAVEWDTESFDPNKLGEQTITGSLILGGKYENTQKFTPTVKIIVRAKGEDLRQTIYISTSGDEANDGLSPENPKKEIKNIASYLKQGYNVRLKRGDVWYMPTGSLSFRDIHGTEDVPVVLGAYGSGDELPMIGFMKKIENNAWKLVDEKRNIYEADVSDIGQRNGQSVHRCFVNDTAYNHKTRTNIAALKAEEFCSFNGKLYIRMPEGQVPNNVEVTPYGGSGTRMTFTEVSYLTVEYIHFKGSSAINSMIQWNAPTNHLKFQYLSITHCFYYILVMETSDEQVHYKPEISNCYIDACFSEEEGAKNDDTHWNVSITEGIVMRDGVEEGWIHHNHIRNMSHAFITVESLDRDTESRTRGVFNCVIEDNLLEGGNALYARAFSFCGGYNLSGIQMCRDNTWRRNRCYDMTTSSHLFGEDNLIYSNIFSYVHCEYDEDDNLFDGKNAQPFGFDVLTYSDHGCVGNVVVNNTFYNVSSAVALYDKGGAVYNSIFANNLIVNWTSDAGAVYGSAGAIYDNTSGMIFVMNNGVYADGRKDHFVVDGKTYSADDANTQIAGYSGNIYADPKFVDADLTLMDKEVRLDFTLSGDSPFRYAGLALYDSVYEGYSAWERLKAEYTDLNGVKYLAESPSIGAISYSEKIKGEVASVDTLEDIVARTGADISQLALPRTVTAWNEQGIEAVLPIDWIEDTFDSSKTGIVTITGNLRNGPHTDLNVTGKTVSINVVIKDKLELLSISTQLKELTVLYNTSFEDAVAQLPQKIAVVSETGFQEEVPVIWRCDSYDPTEPDTYTFKCVLPEDMLSGLDEFDVKVNIRVLHEIGRGMELLDNPDFIDGTSASPWKIGWGNGKLTVTEDPRYLMAGEPASVIVSGAGRYASLQQNVTGQVQLLGDGKYLMRCYMRSYAPGVTIDSSYACVQVIGKTTDVYRCRAKINIGENWVEYYAVMDIDKTAEASEVIFHTSTGKTAEDVEDGSKSFVISGCSFIYLGNTDEEVEATLDSVELDWNMIKGENSYDKTNVMSDLTLPTKIGEGSTIKWTSSDESVITNDGKVTMGRVPKEVTLTATVTYNGIETVKKFELTVPRDPSLPTFSGAISGSQTVNVGDEFQVTVSLAGEKASAFNAYRFTFSFNTSKLEYIGCSDAASSVEVDGGKITVSGIGTERPITDTITLTFKAKKSGITEVKLVKVEMDLDANASLDNLPTMTVTEGAALIDVQKVEETEGTEVTEKDNSSVIWIVVGLVAAALICGGVIAIILIKKKKQTPPSEN